MALVLVGVIAIYRRHLRLALWVQNGNAAAVRTKEEEDAVLVRTREEDESHIDKSLLARLANGTRMPSGEIIYPRAYDLIWKENHGNNDTVDLYPYCHFSTLSQIKQHETDFSSFKGFFFVKPVKVAGSTAAGVHLRIAKNVAERKMQQLHQHEWSSSSSSSPPNNVSMCKARFDHGKASHRFYGSRDRTKSFLWTILRDPAQRALSDFFHFKVSRYHVQPTDANFQHFLQEKHMNHYYMRYLSFFEPKTLPTLEQCLRKYPYLNLNQERIQKTNKSTSIWNKQKRGKKQTRISYSKEMMKIAHQILQDYDFIAITERFEESLVVLQMILGLTTADILFLSTKHKGSYDGGGFHNKCVWIQPSFLSDGMNDLFTNNTIWKCFSDWDFALYQAANSNLDYTIQTKLGRTEFQDQLQKFRHAQQLMKESCLQEAIFPCPNPNYDNTTDSIHQPIPENKTNCLWLDSACGWECMDRISMEHHLFGNTV